MRNVFTKSAPKLIPQIKAAIPGVNKYAVELGLDAGLEAALTAKKDALVTEDSNYEVAKEERRGATTALRTALRNGDHHIRAVRELVKPTLGVRYSQAWDSFGFSGKLTVPRTVDAMVLQLTKLGNHLTANPALGTEEPLLAAARTTALEAALTAAKAALSAKKSALQQKRESRALKALAVQMAMRELFGDLRFKLSPLDGRWVEFGFNKPGAQPTPPVPEGVTAVLLGTNTISVKWPAVPRADYYRLWTRVIGVDTEWQSRGSSADLSALLEQLPSNADVETAVSAVNESGESALSTPVLVRTL